MNAWRRSVLVATTVLVAFAASAGPALPAAAAPPPPPEQEVQSWALIPANDDPSKGGSRSDLTYVVDAGAEIQDSVTLMNLGTDTLTFRVFSTDAFNNGDGEFDVLPSDQVPLDVGSWVTFPQEMITVPAGKEVVIPITINVPAGASAGDHVGAVLASSPSVGVGGNGQVITLDRRTGTRIYLRVNGPLFPELSIADLDTSYDQAVNPLGGAAQVTFTIVNTGNVRLSGVPHVSVGGPFGFAETDVTLPEIAQLLPGEQVEISADLDGVAAAVLDTTSVRVDVIGAEDVGEINDATARDNTFAPPLFLLGVLLVMLFGLLAFRAYRRRAAATATPAEDSDASPARELEHSPS